MYSLTFLRITNRTLQKKKGLKKKKKKETLFLVDFLYSLDSVRSLEMQRIPASFALYALMGSMQFPWFHAVLSIVICLLVQVQLSYMLPLSARTIANIIT